MSNRLALLIPAHNEELVLEATIRGAMAAQVMAQDIYLVDDSSTDRTLEIGRSLLGEQNILHVERSGKAGAIGQAIRHFYLSERYEWLQILDADSIFSPNYFSLIRQHFSPEVAAVCGQTKSLKHNWITAYRAYEYTISHDFYKSLMGKFNLITIMPGPASCFATRILSRLEFATDTLTEDFDLTLQIHHQKLGRIAYEPRAYSWTQDPFNLRIYTKQVNRWYTGFFQVLKKHRIGRRLRGIDLLLLFLTLDGFAYLLQLAILGGLTMVGKAYLSPLSLLASDLLIMFMLVWYAAFRTGRPDVLTPMPLYYVLRLLNIAIFIWAAIKVFLLPRTLSGGVWTTGRMAQGTQVSLMKGGVTS